MKKQLTVFFATTAAAVGLYFAGYSYAAASTVVTVKAGDTVSKLAAEYNDTINGIQQRNSLANVNLITVGQQLKVGSDNVSTAKTTTTNNAQYGTTTPKVATNSSYQTSANKTQAATNNYASAAKSNVAATTKSTGNSSSYTSKASGSDASAKAWIANRESGGSYSATNGQYIGKYQLSSSYLNGDYSAANQEKVADKYVSSRYGSWSAAKSFWQANGWY